MHYIIAEEISLPQKNLRMSLTFSKLSGAPRTHMQDRNLNTVSQATPSQQLVTNSNVHPILLYNGQWLPLPKTGHSPPSFHSQTPNLHLPWLPQKAFLTLSNWFHYSSFYIPAAPFVTIIKDITIISLFFLTITPTGQEPNPFTIWTK